MKKKRILSYIAGFIMLFLALSCTNLDEKVYDKLPADEFGNTTVELNALIGTVYNKLKTYWPNNFMYISECAGSMAVTPTRIGGDWYDSGQYRELYTHSWTAQTEQIRNSWSAASTAIGTCNATISVLENSELLNEEEKKSRIAEIRGVRAFWIYAMMDAWGNIPLVTSYDDKDLPACKTRQEIFDWLIQEVTEITTLCPDHSSETYGKFTKGSAYTLLAKLYLNAEAWNVTTTTNAYQQCIEACNKVIEMGYILEPNWKSNFNLTNNTSQEAIFAICFSDQDTEDQNQLMNRTLHYQDNLSIGAGFSAWNGICAQPEYVKLFDEEDPRYEGTFRIGQRYHLETGVPLLTDQNDPLNYTVDIAMIPGSEYDGTPWGNVVQEAGARCNKWEYSSSLTDAMENDFHIFRLADVYLMKAEALLRSGGSVGDATSLVNAIRERAYGHSDKNYASVTLELIALERKFELAWEAYSRQDDIRFGTFETGAWAASNCTRLVGEYLKLFPISFDAWQSNQNLTQNPGYAPF
ncbi:MAG: RagB/SusD family nutrient uptake outer membrane protein [Tannerellaceae bacterium]|nr:RagB/SusD family nutrient uptake outer membrane protein [Tannerellaceae bacterium]